jgi:streptomycin 6-kinase
MKRHVGEDYRRLVQERIPRRVEAVLREREALLPEMRERLLDVVDAWDIRVTDPMQEGWNSFVAAAATSENVVVMLKLTAERETIAREATALGWWGEEVAPRVLRHDTRLGAMLMERLEPGAAIDWRNAADTVEVVSVLEGVHRPLAGARLPLPLLSDLGAEALETMRQDAEQKRHLVGADVADMALVVLHHLFARTEATDRVVLHGDAVPVNVLVAHDGLRVIDPRPAIGERAYDAGYWSTFSGYGRDARSNVSILARTLHLEEQRVLAWAWALAVKRLLQLADSQHPGHGALCDELRSFIAERQGEVTAFAE